jgi:phage shock protein PspC (stress-responsive transcriptional regulator)
MPRKPPTSPSADSTEETTPPAPETPPTPPASENRFFSWIRGIDIRREPGWIGGVCAGIAARLGIDPLIVRGIAVVIAVLGGPAILLYAAAWLLLPDANDKIHLEEVFRGKLEPAIAGIGALIVLSLLPVTQGFWFAGAGFWGEPQWGASFGRALWVIVLLGLLVWFVVWIARRSSGDTPSSSGSRHQGTTNHGKARSSATTRPESAAAFVASETVTPPADATEPEVAEWREQQAQVRAEHEAFRNQQASDRAAANRAAAEEARRVRDAQRAKDLAAYTATRSNPLYSLVVIGLSLVAGGAAALTFTGGQELTLLSSVVGLSVMLAVLALGIVINGIRGKRSGGAAGVAWLVLLPLLVTAAVATSENPVVRWGPASTLAPTTGQEFFIGAGRVELDLTELEFGVPTDGFYGQEVELNMGAGDVTVIVPDDTWVQFSATVAAGSIDGGPDERSTRVGPVETVTSEFGPTGEDIPQLIVSVHLGAGQIRVVESGDNQ